jgi:putative ABC transport system permease protein
MAVVPAGAVPTALRHAARRLRRVPTYALAVVVALALGIGASAAVFSLVNTILLRPLPYPQSDRIVGVRHTARTDLPALGVSNSLTLYYGKENHSFADVGMYFERVVTFTGPGEAERVSAAEVSPNVFSILHVTPALGRLPVTADFDPSHSYSTGVLIGYGLWMRRYAGDPTVVGRPITINSDPAVIVGVAPPGFQFPKAGTQAWLGTPPERLDGVAKAQLRALYYSGIGRLKPGASIAGAQRDLQRLVDRIPEAFPATTRAKFEPLGLRAEVVPLKDLIVGHVSARLWLVLATAAFLLLLTWTNVTNLALVHAERQRKDIAVERALGATTGHLAVRCLAEGVLLGVVAGGLGFGLAALAVSAQFGFQAEQLPRVTEVRVDGTLAGAVVVLTTISILLVTVVSLVSARRPARAGSLSSGLVRTTSGRQEQRARRVLVGAQLAIALTLLIASGLMVQSFWRLLNVPLGFRPAGVYTFFLPTNALASPDYAPYARVTDELLTKLRVVPGVEAAESATRGAFPVAPAAWINRQRTSPSEGPAADSTKSPSALFGFATPGYFKAMGIPLLTGRTFLTSDMNPGSSGVVVSAALARALFGDQPALGRQVRFDPTGERRYTVVGVVGDIPTEGIAEGPSKTLYFPNVFPLPIDPATGKPAGAGLSYLPTQEMYVLRTTLPAASILRAARNAVREVDPRLVVVDPQPLDALVAGSIAGTRLTMLLLVVAAVTALIVGLVGIYGIQAYAVTLRTSELAVRIALGASPASATAMVVREAALLTTFGIAAGLLAAAGVTRLMVSLLYGVRPGDPVVYAAMATLLAAVALGASYLPARRVGRIDLVQALGGGT